MTRGSPNPPLSTELVESMTERADNGCLLWTGPLNSYGYARYKFNAKWHMVHRWVCANAHGPIPDGWTVDHQCHDPEVCTLKNGCPHRRCVEPSHLLAMTNGANAMRGGGPTARKARQTHCIHGHSLEGDNLYVTPGGRRQCRKCRSAALVRWATRLLEKET